MCAEYKGQMLKDPRIKLGFTSAFARKGTPAVNVTIEGDSIVHRGYVGLGVAVAITQGSRHACAGAVGLRTTARRRAMVS
jgi:hypothetical protein